MTIINLLEKEHSKKQMLKIVRFVGNDQKKFDELISFCFGKNEKLAQRASWPVRYCIEKHPDLGSKHIRKMLTQMKKPGHNSIRRNFLKAFESMKISLSFEAELINVCFDLLNKKDEPVAVKAFSMILLFNYCLKYPDLGEELKACIVSQLPFGSAGFRSCGNKIVNYLEKSEKVKVVKNFKGLEMS